MINCKIFTDNGEFTTQGNGIPKTFKNAYLTSSSSASDCAAFDNQKMLRKYHPKVIVSAVSTTRCFPTWLRTSSKNLKVLKTESVNNTKGSLRCLRNLEVLRRYDDFKENALQFRTVLLSSKKLEKLKLRASLDGKMLKGIGYLRALQSLDLNVTDKHLPILLKLVRRLTCLESISLLFEKKWDDVFFDPSHFLNLCQRLLAERQLKMLKIDFDRSFGNYLTETFEKLFQQLETAKIEKWNIQAMLAEDQVIEMAEKYRVFREADHIAISRKIMRFSPEGTMSYYLSENSFEGKNAKLLNIYLQDSLENERGRQFDLEAILKHCSNIEHLYIDWEKDLMKHSLNQDSMSFPSLKTIIFVVQPTEANNWWHMLRILENTPSLERFHLHTSNSFIDPKQGAGSDAIKKCLQRLAQIKTLKSVDFKVIGLSQENFDAFQILFETLEGLKELKFSLYPLDNPSLTIFRFPISNLTELTELRLCLPYASDSQIESLTNTVSHLPNLSIVEFWNQGDGPIHWIIVQKLMKKLQRLASLKEFSFSSSIIFGLLSEEGSERYVDLIKKEIVDLVTHCRVLEIVKMRYFGCAVIEYSKYQKAALMQSPVF